MSLCHVKIIIIIIINPLTANVKYIGD